MNTSNSLKNCPFCGGEAVILYLNSNWVQCKCCGCGTMAFDSEEEAIETWNKRVEA